MPGSYFQRWINARVAHPLVQWAGGRRIWHRLERLRRLARMTPTARAAWHNHQLTRVVTEAGRHVPYYRDLFAELRFDPSRLADEPARLSELPLLHRGILKEQGRRMLDERLAAGRLAWKESGGSITQPAEVAFSPGDLDWTSAVVLWCQEQVGILPTHSQSSVVHSDRPALRPRLIHRIRDQVLNRATLRAPRLDARRLDEIWQWIRSRSADVVTGRPSMFVMLLARLHDRGEDPCGVIPVIETTGERLDPSIRHLIADGFRTRLVDRYGQGEFGVMAYELPGCPPDCIRLLDFVIHGESVPLESGQEELICTGLLNRAMPLIRYRTGDVAELRRGGHATWIYGAIERVTDAFRLDGRLWTCRQLRRVLDEVGNAAVFQVDLAGGKRPVLRVVPGPGDDGELARRIDWKTGGCFDVQVNDPPQMLRAGWGRKLIPVIPPEAAEDLSRPGVVVARESK